MTYGTACGVGALCRSLIGADLTFTTSTSPTKQQVDDWLSSGCSVIETHLAGRGYEMPVASTARAYSWIQDLEELWGAAHAELSRTNATFSPEQRSRGQIFYDYFWDQLDRLSKLDLSRVGDIGRSATGKIYVGGISAAEKQSIENDSDLLKPRFFRGMGKFSETIDPTPSTASES